MDASKQQITRLLNDLNEGNEEALDQLIPLIYSEMKHLAQVQLRRERSAHTLNTTALVHEAYLKLVGQQVEWQNRGHFFAVASMVMRRILVNHARKRSRQKRGGDWQRIAFDERLPIRIDEQADEILALDDALTRLATINERAVHVVECRFFGGLTIEETGHALNVSPMTVKRDWRLAKTWLRREL